MFLYPTGARTELERPPYVVYGLLISFVVIQTCMMLADLVNPRAHLWVVSTFGFIPARQNWWALVTSLFVHTGTLWGWPHLLGNALYLWLFGAGLENRMGHWAFAIFYLTAGICAGLIHGTGVHPLAYGKALVGASGAVAGVLGAYLVLMPLTDIRLAGCCMFWPVSFHLAAIWFLPLWFLLEFTRAKWGGAGPEAHVAYWAHVGGFLIGIPVGVLVRASESGKKGKPSEELEETRENVAALMFQRNQRELRGHLVDGDFPAAWLTYSQIQAEFPGALVDSDCQLSLGELAVREGEYHRAIELYRTLANSNRSEEIRARAAYRMGVVYLERLADREQAVRVFQILINKFPETDAARGAEERLSEIFPQH
jgi:membrane associated rhomboid family serine protease